VNSEKVKLDMELRSLREENVLLKESTERLRNEVEESRESITSRG
jgi:hypothetical protein